MAKVRDPYASTETDFPNDWPSGGGDGSPMTPVPMPENTDVGRGKEPTPPEPYPGDPQLPVVNGGMEKQPKITTGGLGSNPRDMNQTLGGPNGRWSTGLERAPSWTQGLDQHGMDWAQNLYNEHGDNSNDYIQQLMGQYRGSHSHAAEDDETILRNLAEGVDGGGNSSGNSGPGGGGYADILNTLRSIYENGGGMNQNVINSRVSGVRDQLESFKKSQGASDKAALASRGLLSEPGHASGPEKSSANALGYNVAGQYSNAINNIYADESQNADQRMMSALQTAAGLTTAQAQQAIDQFRANTDRSLGSGQLDLNRILGQGNLALGNMNATNNYNLGLGNLGLGRDQLQYEIEHGNDSVINQILELLYGGASGSAGGYV